LLASSTAGSAAPSRNQASRKLSIFAPSLAIATGLPLCLSVKLVTLVLAKGLAEVLGKPPAPMRLITVAISNGPEVNRSTSAARNRVKNPNSMKAHSVPTPQVRRAKGLLNFTLESQREIRTATDYA